LPFFPIISSEGFGLFLRGIILTAVVILLMLVLVYVFFGDLFVILFFVSITYSVLFHPHVCYLFYPAQSKAGVEPW
jgi:hypothetical protein